MSGWATAAEKPQPAVSVRGLENRFGGILLHDGLDLDVRPGEVLGLVGSSGSGKTVLMRSIIGLNRPGAGEVRVLGQALAALHGRARKVLLSRIGVLFQNRALFSGLTVAENIALVLKLHTGLAPARIDRLARQKIDMAGLPQDAADRMPAQLSGGMRTRAGLARALALDPEIVFLDEPTAGLDPIGAADFDRLIRELQRSLGLTVFMVTHDLNSLVAVADRIAVLTDGKVRVGSLEELLKDPDPWVQAYFHGPRARAAHSAAGSGR